MSSEHELELYAPFAQILSLCQSQKDDLEAILDPETGYAPRMKSVCEDRLHDLLEGENAESSEEEIDLLKLEANTWGLIQVLLAARLTSPNTDPNLNLNPRATATLTNPYTPPLNLAQTLISSSPLLSELIVVREWLHETAPVPSASSLVDIGVGSETGYWRFTKATIVGGTGGGGTVKHLDPDAPNRENASLAPDDASSTNALLTSLTSFIRAGRLADAIQLCVRANQPWRAASVRGALVFGYEWDDDDKERDAEDEAEEQKATYSGNLNRKLWKAMCVRAALSPSLPSAERTLYASLSPTLQTLPVLKSAAKSWEDHLWAEICVLVEERIEREVEKVVGGSNGGGGSFWEEVGAGSKSDAGGAATRPKAEQEWKKEVQRALEGLKGVRVSEGQPPSHPYHYSQLLLILDRTDQLLESFAERLAERQRQRQGGEDEEEEDVEYTSMARFFAHLCLFLQLIDVPVPPMATQVILEGYLTVLEEASQRDLIALYTSALGDNAVERYAAFLVSLGVDADYSERRQALNRASEHGLDVRRVAVRAAERSLEKGFGLLPPTTISILIPLTAAQPPPSVIETFLLRSIEWTTFQEETYDVALEQATVILRYFLGTSRLPLALSLLSLLPAELANLSEPEEIATEYLHYRQLFMVWEGLEAVVGLGDVDVNSFNKNEYQVMIDNVHEQIAKLLTTEWLINVADFEEGYEGLDKRRRQLVQIRQVYIPELVMRLHHVLYTSRVVVDGNLKRALELANVVADSRYRLYDDFVSRQALGGHEQEQGQAGGRTLAEYLGAVRQAVLAGLENGGSDAFKVVGGH